MKEYLRLKGRKKFESLPFALLIISTIIYIVIWSYISVERILSLQATYFDLGSFMERLWSVANIRWNFTSFMSVFSNTGLQFFMFPIAYFHSYMLIVTIQSAAIGLCTFPIYGISRLIIKSKSISVLISISFLIYFPIAGSNYFDVHFQSFFPILFISGYYFYLKKNYKLSILLFFLSGTVRYPYFIFPGLFALIGIVETVLNGRSNYKSNNIELRDRVFYFTSIFIISGVFLLIRFITAGTFTNVIITSTAGSYDFWDRIITVIMLFGPLLFLPFLSKRWILFFIPMLYLIFFGPTIYYFPMIFHDQYALIIYPFIYLGLIDGISLLKGAPKVTDNGLRKTLKFQSFFKGEPKKVLFMIACVFLIIILLDTAFEPYGPLNSTSPANYGLNQSRNINITEFNALSNAIKLIPSNNPYVLTQNNIIELFPRTTIPPDKITSVPLIAGMLNIGQNLTLKEIEQNKIPFDTGYGTTYTNIDFVLADVNSSWYNFDSYGYPSMSTLISELYSSGYYGIVAEDQGIILLQRDYKGKIEFSGLYLQYLPSQLQTDYHASLDNGQIVVANSPMPKVDGLASWYGPYTGLPPGSYNVVFELATTNYSKTNSIVLQATEWPQNLAVMNITGSSFDPIEKVGCFSLHFSTSEFYPRIEFRGVDAQWNGTLILYGIMLVQLSP